MHQRAYVDNFSSRAARAASGPKREEALTASPPVFSFRFAYNPHMPAKRTERRASPRVYPSRSVRLVDISPGGVTVETGVALKKNEAYDLILRLDDFRIPVAARVLRLRKRGDVVRASMMFERIFDTDRALLEQVLVREVAERMTIILR